MDGPDSGRATPGLHLRWIAEDRPGAGWLALFRRAWPAYRGWFLREGDDARPELDLSRRKLGEAMPELMPVWERLVGIGGEVAGDGSGAEEALVARMLTLYRPTAFLAGCSQAVLAGEDPLLIRNYDYDPGKFEGVFLRSNWTGTRVLATSDCLWGVLDGVNEHGLVVALSFGGRREVGEGFGIPLILRYVLEVCATVDEAVEVLRAVPSHMAYNVSLLDRSGMYAVAQVGPGRDLVVTSSAVATNHQGRITWSAYAKATASREREDFLLDCLETPGLTGTELEEAFLRPPLYLEQFNRGFGTLYTVVYRPGEGPGTTGASAAYRWPEDRVDQSVHQFEPGERGVALGGRAGLSPGPLGSEPQRTRYL